MVRKAFFFVLLHVLISTPLLAEKGKNIELLASSCSSCHGTRGHSIGGVPSLAGLDKLHFMEQMDQFITGRRVATVMHHYVNGYTKDEIKLLAQFFSQQKYR